jgi:hypothetical protein
LCGKPAAYWCVLELLKTNVPSEAAEPFFTEAKLIALRESIRHSTAHNLELKISEAVTNHLPGAVQLQLDSYDMQEKSKIAKLKPHVIGQHLIELYDTHLESLRTLSQPLSLADLYTQMLDIENAFALLPIWDNGDTEFDEVHTEWGRVDLPPRNARIIPNCILPPMRIELQTCAYYQSNPQKVEKEDKEPEEPFVAQLDEILEEEELELLDA